MDYDLNEQQRAIVESIDRLLDQQSSTAHIIKLNRGGGYDHALHEALEHAGFFSLAQDLPGAGETAGLEAALAVEAIARNGGVVAGATQMLVSATTLPGSLPGPVALCTQQELLEQTPVRFAAQAKSLLVVDDIDALVFDLNDSQRESVRTSFGYPMGRIAHPGELKPVQQLAGSAGRLRAWWRVALAVEATGTMEAALHCVVDYLKQRRQFGRAIGSFQAVQHRLAECAIQVEASRWLAREAAYHCAPAQSAAAAAAFALQAADLVFSETHQLSGAIGFTHEFDLHIWSMRLLALRQELGGVSGSRAALVTSRWGASAG